MSIIFGLGAANIFTILTQIEALRRQLKTARSTEGRASILGTLEALYAQFAQLTGAKPLTADEIAEGLRLVEEGHALNQKRSDPTPPASAPLTPPVSDIYKEVNAYTSTDEIPSDSDLILRGAKSGDEIRLSKTGKVWKVFAAGAAPDQRYVSPAFRTIA